MENDAGRELPNEQRVREFIPRPGRSRHCKGRVWTWTQPFPLFTFMKGCPLGGWKGKWAFGLRRSWRSRCLGLKLVWGARLLVLMVGVWSCPVWLGPARCFSRMWWSSGSCQWIRCFGAAYPGENKVPAPVKQCQALWLEANWLKLELFPMDVFNFIFLWKDYWESCSRYSDHAFQQVWNLNLFWGKKCVFQAYMHNIF